MSTIVIDVSPEVYQRLTEQSQRAGKNPEIYTRELLESALEAQEVVQPKTTREVLQSLGQLRPLSDNLKQKIIPGVTLAEAQKVLAETGGRSLSEIILAQRGAKF